MRRDISAQFRFEKFTLLTSEKRLLADGQPVALGSRAIDLLLVLVQRRGEVVSKDELFKSAWPGLVVEDNNLAVQMSVLRKLLGRSAIVNVARLGYRFALPVEELPDEAAPAAPPPTAEQRANDLLAPLPMPPELMLGRATDSVELDQLMHKHRLVTIVGPSGVGKTALAMVAAHARRGAMRDGAVWIDVAAIHQPALVPRVLIQALRLPAGGNDDALPDLVAPLRQMQMLVIFDNAEHLADAVAQLIHTLLAGAPGLRMLVTSQAALKISSERVFRLEPLAFPPADCSLDDACTHGAVALFVDQAQRVGRRFALDERNLAVVIALCRQLDGLPLAIKLTTARLPIFGVEGLRTRLADRFSLLRAQAPDLSQRHQTLLAALDWSHGLLPPDARKVFRRLSVFAGGFSLELAVATVGHDSQDDWVAEDMLEVLAHHSLLAVEAGAPPRYRMLDSVREYARLELESSGESDATHRRHAQAMLALFRSASQDAWTHSDADFLGTYSQEIDNVRVALDWCLQHDGPLGAALLGEAGDLFHALLLFRENRELHAACERWLTPDLPPAVLARCHLERGRTSTSADPRRSRDESMRAAKLYRELGDSPRLYLALTNVVHSMLTPISEARELLQEQIRLEQPGWPPRLLRMRMVAEALTCSREERHADACAAAKAALAYARQAGAAVQAAVDQSNLAYAYLASGDTAQAVVLGRELVAGKFGRYARQRIYALGNLSNALLAEGEVAEARQRVAEFFGDCRDGGWECFGIFSDVYGLLAACEGRFEAAARLIGHADHVHQPLGQRFPALATAREHALRLIAPALEAERLQDLMAEGRTMDREAVCRLTLDTGMA